MSAARLSTGTSGNISIYNAEKGLMAISPSGIDYFSTKPEDVVTPTFRPTLWTAIKALQRVGPAHHVLPA